MGGISKEELFDLTYPQLTAIIKSINDAEEKETSNQKGPDIIYAGPKDMQKLQEEYRKQQGL